MENNSYIDDIILKTILEKLQKIQDSIKETSSNIDAEDISGIQILLFQTNEKINTLNKFLDKLPKCDYSGPIDRLSEWIIKLKTGLDENLKSIEKNNKHKRIGIISFGTLILLLIISTFMIVELNNKYKSSRVNDYKFRYMQTLGSESMYKNTLLTDSIFRNFELDFIKNKIESREELIRQKIEAELRAKEKESEAQKLRIEAEKLKKLTK